MQIEAALSKSRAATKLPRDEKLVPALYP